MAGDEDGNEEDDEERRDGADGEGGGKRVGRSEAADGSELWERRFSQHVVRRKEKIADAETVIAE